MSLGGLYMESLFSEFYGILWFNFILGLNLFSFVFGGMVMYDNEFETKENKI